MQEPFWWRWLRPLREDASGGSLDLAIDAILESIDRHVGAQLDAILHHPAVVALARTWTSAAQLARLLSDSERSWVVNILSIDSRQLQEDFEDSPHLLKSGLRYHLVCRANSFRRGDPDVLVLLHDLRASDGWLLDMITATAAGSSCVVLADAPHELVDYASGELRGGFETGEPSHIHGLPQIERADWSNLVLCGPRPFQRPLHEVRTDSLRYAETEVDGARLGHACVALAERVVSSHHETGWPGAILGDVNGERSTEEPLGERAAMRLATLGITGLVATSPGRSSIPRAPSAARLRDATAPEGGADDLPALVLARRLVHVAWYVYDEYRSSSLGGAEAVRQWLASQIVEAGGPARALEYAAMEATPAGYEVQIEIVALAAHSLGAGSRALELRFVV